MIGILDKYTNDDLAAWSRVWVNEKGMPEICGVISEDGKSLQVSQKDPLGRGLLWEQDLSFLVVYPDGGTEDVQVSFGKEQASCLKELKRQASEGCFVMPNADGKGYGFFRLLEKDAKACLGNLPACKDEVLRGSLLITLYENLLNRTILQSFIWKQCWIICLRKTILCCSRPPSDISVIANVSISLIRRNWNWCSGES